MNSLGINKEPKDTLVVVAMSGGVDSSVVAGLLHEQGYRVIGITLQLYDYGMAVGKKGACCAGQDIYDAKMVADKLGIAHYVLDYESRFKQDVIDDFADSYLRGETPVPCIKCNQTVKFRDLVKAARELGADCLATGHYVRRVMGENGAEMHAGADMGRDQSYFLYTTLQDQLDYLRFPLGDLSKDETRAMAGRMGLAVADKPDSQDICFVPNGDYASVVMKLRPDAADPGDIVDLSGNVLGRHEGILHYTVGQRKGLGIGGRKDSDGDALYVIRLNPELKQVVVGPREALGKDRFMVAEINWLGARPIADGEKVLVKMRSMQPLQGATLYPRENNMAEVVLDEPRLGIAPGQACVFYRGSHMLGGGWIRRDSVDSGQWTGNGKNLSLTHKTV
ncbi:MAG: tRNA 2-thiouridine(34) synthase MnmA [Alphaproteobacteria bacterium]|nr:MAG: tRNA 2-thiouridine(34) synthase MnmA [Alphaproteobacteria bacterium]